jgi:hypothetical protein
VGRFDDDLHLVDSSEYQPTMVSVLLNRAGLTDASRAEQAEAIRQWLKSHKPSPMMEFSIRQSGFAQLLDERVSP